MGGATTSPSSGPPSGPDRPPDDPLAADKRTLIIAVVAMIGLVSVGIVSAALFTGSACQDITPTPVATAGGVADIGAVGDVLADLDPAIVEAVEAQLADLADRLGPVTGVAIVDGADALTATVDGLAATGSIISLLPSSGDGVSAAAAVGSGVVVGSGDALMSLARVNDLTGQVDAFASIDTTGADGLSEIGCVDTATVGTPLAFEVDADGGQLMLFRADEDGDDAELELRDPRDGRLWFTRVDVGMAPPGVTGERIDGRLAGDVAVLVRRTTPGEDVPLVTALDRADGTERWQVGREDLATVPVPATSAGADDAEPDGSSVVREDAAQRLEVLAVDDQQVVIAITDARDEDAVVSGGTDALGPSIGPGRVIGLDVRDGTPRWQRPLAAGDAVLAATGTGAGVWLVLDDGAEARLVGVDTVGGSVASDPDGVVSAVGARSTAALTVLGRGDTTGPPGTVGVVGERLVVVRPTGDDLEVAVTDAPAALAARDVLARGDRLHVLFGWPGVNEDGGTAAPTDTATDTPPGASTEATDGRGVVVTFDIGG